eukprot:3774455-Amphidinium_carterae.1
MSRRFPLSLAFLEERLQRLAPFGAFLLRLAPKSTSLTRTECPRADSRTFLELHSFSRCVRPTPVRSRVNGSTCARRARSTGGGCDTTARRGGEPGYGRPSLQSGSAPVPAHR